MRPHDRMAHRIRHLVLGFLGQAHQLPLAVLALVDMDALETVEALFRLRRQILVSPVHVDVLRVAALVRSLIASNTVALGGVVSFE